MFYFTIKVRVPSKKVPNFKHIQYLILILDFILSYLGVQFNFTHLYIDNLK